MKTLNDFNFKNKKALIRVDFNVPLNDEFQVTDTTRIKASKSTIIKVLEDGGSIILLSHLGRPKGFEDKFSLRHVVDKVTEIIGVQVKFINNCIGKEVQEAVANLENGQILLLENVRFYPEEKKGDVSFAKQLSQCYDIYINDAFGTAHRTDCSTTTITQFFPKNKCFGHLLSKEIKNIDKVLKSTEKPVTAILAGSKVSSKIGIIKNILTKVDHIIIAGGMTFTFIKALGGNIGNSLVEDDKIKLALEILSQAKQINTKIHLPIDVVIANKFDNEAQIKTADIYKIPDQWMGLDIGSKTLKNFAEIIEKSKTILWNGPLGVFEMENFAKGTISIGNTIVKTTENGAFSLVGGGDSIAAVKKFGFANKVSYVSTGGGAMLEMLEGKTLPAIKAMLK